MKNMGRSSHFNERYLHHYFSSQILKEHPIEFSDTCQFHPEWATEVKNTGRKAKYLRTGKKYCVDDVKGSSGFVDFALGSLDSPYCGIEFKMSTIFNKEGVIYDYMKLLDSWNPFNNVVSVVVYYGHKKHSEWMAADKLTDCVLEAERRLGSRKKAEGPSIHIHFIVAEIYERNATIFECTQENGTFMKYNLDN